MASPGGDGAESAFVTFHALSLGCAVSGPSGGMLLGAKCRAVSRVDHNDLLVPGGSAAHRLLRCINCAAPSR